MELLGLGNHLLSSWSLPGCIHPTNHTSSTSPTTPLLASQGLESLVLENEVESRGDARAGTDRGRSRPGWNHFCPGSAKRKAEIQKPSYGASSLSFAKVSCCRRRESGAVFWGKALRVGLRAAPQSCGNLS